MRNASYAFRTAAILATTMLAGTAESATAQPETPAVLTKINAADIEITERSVEHDGVTFRVRELGNGAAVVFLTGGPGFAGEQLLSTARAQAGEHLAIVPDQRGTGGSAVETYDPTKFTIEQAVADLEALRVALDVERWSLVGHSWGSLLSMAYAAEHPGRVRALALVSPAGVDSSFWSAYQANLMQRVPQESMATLQTLRPAAQTPEAMGDYYREVNKILAPASIANPADHPETVAALKSEMSDGMNPMVSLSMQPALMQFDLRPKLAEFNAPTVIIQGDQDPIGRDTAERIAETIKSASIRTIKDCGHWPMHEQPTELNTTLANFLSANDDDC